MEDFITAIKNHELTVCADDDDEEILPIVDHEEHLEPFDVREIPELYDRMYKVKYHLNEIFKRIQCIEPNKPAFEEVEQIKEKLNGDFSKKNIHSNTTYNQRKHLIYIYCTLNNKPYLNLDSYEQAIKTCFGSVMHADVFERRKLYNLHFILDVIAQKYQMEHIRDYLYYKPMRKHDEKFKVLWGII